MDKLSKSISENKASKSQGNSSKAPLSQLKPNTVGAESDSMSLKDMKKAFVHGYK